MNTSEKPIQEPAQDTGKTAHDKGVGAVLPLSLRRRIVRRQTSVADMAVRHGLSHPDTVAASQELDTLILAAMRVLNPPDRIGT